MRKLKWKLEVSLAVDPMWVEDGFNATPKWVTEFLRENLLTYARRNELSISVKTISAPDKKTNSQLERRIEVLFSWACILGIYAVLWMVSKGWIF